LDYNVRQCSNGSIFLLEGPLNAGFNNCITSNHKQYLT